jgi:hypothetical protein
MLEIFCEIKLPADFDPTKEPYGSIVLVSDMLSSTPLNKYKLDKNNRTIQLSFLVESGIKSALVVELRNSPSRIFELTSPSAIVDQKWSSWTPPNWIDSTDSVSMAILKNRNQKRSEPSKGDNFQLRVKYVKWVSPSKTK